MALASFPPSTVWLPCYEGYNQWAVWPSHQSVSIMQPKEYFLDTIIDDLEQFLLWAGGC